MERHRDKKHHWKFLYFASFPLMIFLILPLLALIFRLSPSDLIAALSDRQATQAIKLSIITTVITTALAVLAGTPVAYFLSRKKFPGHAVIDTLIDLPIVLPPSVAGVALLVAFGRRGVMGPFLANFHIDIAFTQIAVVLAQLFVASPYYIKSAAAGFSAVDRDLEQAAAIDGASPFKTFWSVTLPLAFPAVIGGAVMTWARALGEFGATIIFAGNFPGKTQTMPLAIYMGFEVDLKIAITLAFILLVVSFSILLIVKGILHNKLSVF
jgi:molybdate transport system permease protein